MPALLIDFPQIFLSFLRNLSLTGAGIYTLNPTPYPLFYALLIDFLPTQNLVPSAVEGSH